MLQNLEIVIGFNGVSDDGAQPLQRLLVGLDVSGDLRLAVEVERASLNGIDDVLDLEALAVEKPIGGFGEAVLEQRSLGQGCGWVLGDDAGSEDKAF